MKRFYNNNGVVNPQAGEDLVEARKKIHEALDIFMQADYNPRDFSQFANHETANLLYDWVVKNALKQEVYF